MQQARSSHAHFCSHCCGAQISFQRERRKEKKERKEENQGCSYCKIKVQKQSAFEEKVISS